MRICAVVFLLAVVAWPLALRAHCDNVRGPVVADAKMALASGDVTPVLKWVKPMDEAELRAAFKKALAVRGASDAARDLADDWFFQTLVRLHRASEGEGFTGLKTSAIAEPLALADASIARGDVDHLVAHLNAGNESLVRARFQALQVARSHANESVEAGRRYVATYTSFMHLIEQLTGADGDGASH